MHEDERVRVWDLALAPGESLEKHVHRLDYLFVVVSGGRIRFADPDDPDSYEDVRFEDDAVVFVEVGPEGKVDNRLTNIGEECHRNFVVELKRD
jgi:redox-sensitive bicupin YhaK (pirin superfamily)